MSGPSWRLGRIAGIPISISPWWLVIVALITWTLGDSYFPTEVPGIAPAASYLLGLASVLLLFAGILAHELGHAVVARRRGVDVMEIELWLLGGVSKMRGEAHAPGDELRYALAGPAVSAVITACFALLALLLPASTPRVVTALVDYELLVNGLILGFNLLPAFPLDGGRVTRAVIWSRTQSMPRATARAAAIGRAFGYALIALGVLALFSGVALDGIWLIFVGFFITMAAQQQALQSQVQATFSGVHARDLMATPVVSMPASLALGAALADYFSRYRYTAFPVVDARMRALGLLTITDIESLTNGAAHSRVVGDVAERDPRLLIAADTDVTELLQEPAFARVGRAVVVDAAGAPIGLVSITDVERALRSARLRNDLSAQRLAS